MESLIDTLSEITFILVAIGLPVVLIFGRSHIRRWLDIREAQLKLGTTENAERAARYADRTERLEERVRVLERIVTDRGLDVADQIEALRGPQAPAREELPAPRARQDLTRAIAAN